MSYNREFQSKGRGIRAGSYKSPGVFLYDVTYSNSSSSIEDRLKELPNNRQKEIYDFLLKLIKTDMEKEEFYEFYDTQLVLSIMNDLCEETTCRREEVLDLLTSNLKKEIRSEKLKNIDEIK